MESFISQKKHVEDMIKVCPVKIESVVAAATPVINNLTNRGESKLLNDKECEAVHIFVRKGIFIRKHLRPDIQPPISILSSRVRNPTVPELEKPVRLCKYLNSTIYLHLVLSIDEMKVIKLYIDTSYAIHEDFRYNSGLATKFGQ